VYCIGDANGKLMLAHAASAQGISGTSFSLHCHFPKKNIVDSSAKSEVGI
jgi:pyruvate/2-oxoglutarate dehydrogenase complex dihydrolipoamide dehydrogenase (E3) component